MSRDLGGELPEAVRARLGGRDVRALMGRAHLVVTVDAQGRPHPAMLSYGELLATGPREIRVATYKSSGTAQNMRRSGHFSLCLVDAGMACYVKGRAEELPPMADFPKLARFRVAVEQVLEDYSQADIEGDARVLGGITFTAGAATEQWLRDWERLLQALAAP
jgi:hypothetical protein